MPLRRGGRLCPPCMTAEPCCRAGPACPAGKHGYRAAGHMGPALQGGRDKPPVGDGVLQWSAAEQMPLGYDVPSARSAALRGPLWEGAVSAADWGREAPGDISPSVTASPCHLPRRGRHCLFYFSTMTLPRFRSARPSCTRASVPAKSRVVCSPLVMSLQAITPLAISSSPRNIT